LCSSVGWKLLKASDLLHAFALKAFVADWFTLVVHLSSLLAVTGLQI
jgi:hypothetical protein